MRTKLTAGLLGVLALAIPASALADVITFDELTNNNRYNSVNPLTSGGFQFVNSGSTADSLIVWGSSNSFNADPGGATVAVNYSGTTTTVTPVGGGTFDFNSIDLADVYNYGTGGDVLFTFLTSGGTTTQTVSLDNIIGLQTFTFNLAGLQSFSFTPVSTDGHWLQFDNLVVNGVTQAVPEPGTWAMMLLGFGGLGFQMRRARAKSALALA
jgi:hypothetical protein